jgi:ribonuclease HI
MGMLLYLGEKKLFSIGIYLGSCKSNAAEFTSLLYSLRIALERGIRKLHVNGDSEVFNLFKMIANNKVHEWLIQS